LTRQMAAAEAKSKTAEAAAAPAPAPAPTGGNSARRFKDEKQGTIPRRARDQRRAYASARGLLALIAGRLGYYRHKAALSRAVHCQYGARILSRKHQ
jgi:hypothetical protein